VCVCVRVRVRVRVVCGSNVWRCTVAAAGSLPAVPSRVGIEVGRLGWWLAVNYGQCLWLRIEWKGAATSGVGGRAAVLLDREDWDEP
jgi:hypothetical protein